MEIVIETFVGLIAIFLAVWGVSLYRAAETDRRKALEAAAETEKARTALERDRHMRSARILLYCMNCETRFSGPLADSGCPGCHSASLVVPDSEYRATISGSSGS